MIMRSKGQVSNISISWVALIFGLLFSLAFAAASIVVMNRYFTLYPEHRELTAAYKEMSGELNRLRNLYAYQYAVADDYARYLNSVGKWDESAGGNNAENSTGTPAEEFIPSAQNPPVESGRAPALLADADGFSVDSWADLFADPAQPPEQELDVQKLRLDGPRFVFQLTNESAGILAQGNLLILFAARVGDRISLASFPEFDFKSKTPDFDQGPAYNIWSSKPVSGRLNLDPEAEVMEMMVVARAKSGNIVLKKKLRPVK